MVNWGKSDEKRGAGSRADHKGLPVLPQRDQHTGDTLSALHIRAGRVQG